MSTTSTDRRNGVNIGAAVKVPCKAATTANITLSGEQTIDGVSCVDGDRVLVKNQTDGIENGIYEVSTSTWQRTKDWDGQSEVKKGTLVLVHSGTVNGPSFWQVTTADTITIGTTSITLALVVNSLAGVSAFMLTLLDDTTSPAAMKTLYDGLASEASPATNDELFLYDLSATTIDKVTLLSVFNLLRGLANIWTAAQTIQDLLDISHASAGQIKFPASQNASADANTLDDYEEGTWTPSVGGTATYTGSNTGSYIKIGKLVFIYGMLAINAIGTGSQFNVSGLPAILNSSVSMPVQVSTWAALATAVFDVRGTMGGTGINFYGTTAANALSSAGGTLVLFQNNSSIVFSAMYLADN